MKPEIVQMFNQIKALSPPDKLRLAAGLLEAQKAQTAYLIARQVTDELGAALALLARPNEEPSRGGQ